MTPVLSANSQFTPYNLKFKNEIIKTLQILGDAGSNEVFDCYLERLDSQNENKLEIIASLWIIRHLITRFYEKTGQHLKRMLFVHLKALSNEDDQEVRRDD